MRDGVPHGHVMAASGLGGAARPPSDAVVGDYEAGLRRSMAMDDAARMQTLAATLDRIADIRQQAYDATNHPKSKSAVEIAREAAFAGVSKPVSMFTGSEILGHLAGWFAANSADDATVIAQEIGKRISEARASAARHQEKLIRHEIPPQFLGRQEM